MDQVVDDDPIDHHVLPHGVPYGDPYRATCPYGNFALILRFSEAFLLSARIPST